MGFPISYPFLFESSETTEELFFQIIIVLGLSVLLISALVLCLVCLKCWRDRRHEALLYVRRDQQETDLDLELELSGQSSQNSPLENVDSGTHHSYQFPPHIQRHSNRLNFQSDISMYLESLRQSQFWGFGTTIDDLTEQGKTSKKGKYHIPKRYLYPTAHTAWASPATIDITGRIIESNSASLSTSPEEGGATGGLEVAMSEIKGTDTSAKTKEKEDCAMFETKFATASATFDDAGAQLKNLVNDRLMPSPDPTGTPKTVVEHFGGAKPKVSFKTSIKKRNKKLKRKSKKNKNKD